MFVGDFTSLLFLPFIKKKKEKEEILGTEKKLDFNFHSLYDTFLSSWLQLRVDKYTLFCLLKKKLQKKRVVNQVLFGAK